VQRTAKRLTKRLCVGEVKTSGTYIRSLEDTKPCDHIYDLKPLRNNLYMKVDAIDVNILPRIYTYQDHDLTDRLRTNEIVARVKPWHQAKLRRAVWTARASQCIEAYESCKEALGGWFGTKKD